MSNLIYFCCRWVQNNAVIMEAEYSINVSQNNHFQFNQIRMLFNYVNLPSKSASLTYSEF